MLVSLRAHDYFIQAIAEGVWGWYKVRYWVRLVFGARDSNVTEYRKSE